MKKFLMSILCVLCLLPTFLVASGTLTIKGGGGPSTMGVIIGPIVGLDDVIIDGGGSYSPDYSNSNLSKDTPYTNGALRAYKNLGVYNTKRDTTYATFKYLSFIRFFRVIRSDGRPIYDDDGVLDVTWDINSPTDEVVDYPCYGFMVNTTLPSNNGGFLWTTLQGRLKSGKLYSNHYENGTLVGSDEKGLPTNPSNSTSKIYDIVTADNSKPYGNANYFAFTIGVTGYWENTFWGGTGDNKWISENMSGYFSIADRNWSNNLTSNATSGTYNGKVAYYSPKPYTVVATNLNNYVKINEVQATPQYGTSVVPFKDGHHIEISNEGNTLVEIENGNEGVYTPFYCFVDTTLPDVEYTYHNSNALENRKVGIINTNANGAKSQTINEGVFKDQVQVNFSADLSKESPETATYTYNGITNPLTSGSWLSQEGNYTVTITDKAGNTTISKFAIDKSAPTYNVNRLENDTNYKVAKWYLVDIPYGYTGYGSYSFAKYDDALSFACNLEKQNTITEYTLNDINDFTNTHLLANGNTIKLGKYWYYKSKENPNLYVYYFDESSLNDAINYYAKAYVSNEQIYKLNTLLATNNYGNKIDKSVYYNIIKSNETNAYIINDFTFRYFDDTETYKIYYDYQSCAL